MAGMTKTHNPDGKRWTRRIKAANSKYRTASRDWEKLRKLYASVYEQRRKWGVSVPLARTLVDGIVADSYIQNPDPFIEFLSDAPDGMEQRLRDLFRTLHEDCDTKTILQRGRVAAACMGLAGHWTDFQQESEVHEASDDDDADDDIHSIPDEGEPPAKAPRAPRAQRITGELVLGWDLRFDPQCRSWDLRDAKWIARMYTRSLADINDDDTGAISPDGKKMLKAWMRGKNLPIRPDARLRGEDSGLTPEDDDAYRMVNVWEIWARPEKKIYHVPVGAEFTIGAYDWKKPWADALDGLGEYPLTLIALNWQLADEDGEHGFYPMPDLRLAQSQLENLPRLEAAFLDSVTNSARKFFGVEGLLDDKQVTQLQTDENRAFMKIDLKALAKAINGGQSLDLQFFDLRKLIVELEQAGNAQAMKHLEAIQHQLELCYMLMGVGPGDRAGVAQAGSATESLGIQERLAVRTEKTVEDMADIADRISEKFWLCLKGAQTLPIPYRRAVNNDETTWDVFTDPTTEFASLDCVFRHHVGSSRPPNRERIKAERRELFALVAPVLQATMDVTAMFEWIHWIVDAYDNKFASRMTRPELKGLAKEIVLLIDQYQNGQEQITPQTADKLLGMVSQFFSRYLSDSEMQQVAQKSVQSAGSQAPGPAGPGGTGSSPRPPSSGQAAYAQARGAAAAGAVGGMTPQ